jgi:hypothetical protein
LIADEKTGYLVKTLDEAIQAVKKLDEISSQDCRTHALEKFGINIMVDAYVQVYSEIIG